MRLPGEVLDRVRGVLVVAALTSCNNEVKPPAPSATTVTASGVAPASPAAPVAIDPVGYTSAGEAERLARLDAEDRASVGARHARLDRLAAQRREEQGLWNGEPPIGLGSLTAGSIGTGIGTGSIGLLPQGCLGCGRG
jgi:hypothetical protein